MSYNGSDLSGGRNIKLVWIQQISSKLMRDGVRTFKIVGKKQYFL